MVLLREMTLRGKTVASVTHTLDNIQLADKVTFLVDGKLAFFGSADEARDYFDVERLPRPTSASRSARATPTRCAPTSGAPRYYEQNISSQLAGAHAGRQAGQAGQARQAHRPRGAQAVRGPDQPLPGDHHPRHAQHRDPAGPGAAGGAVRRAGGQDRPARPRAHLHHVPDHVALGALVRLLQRRAGDHQGGARSTPASGWSTCKSSPTSPRSSSCCSCWRCCR